MDDRAVLDEDYFTEEIELGKFLDWWEHKRLWYNLMLVTVEALTLFSISEMTLKYGIGDAILGCLIFNIGANLCYSIGWAAEIFVYYKFENSIALQRYRWAFFILGIMFSIPFTIITVYDAILSYTQFYY